MKRTLPLVIMCLLSMALQATNLPEKTDSPVTVTQESGFLFLDFHQDKDLEDARKIEIFDTSGRRIFRGMATTDNPISGLNVRSFKKGEYQIKIEVSEDVYMKKFTKS